MAKTRKDLKIPYPVEGLIQSLQMNDTIAPEQSVATAINVVFDRIGAITTRPGNAQYATSLAGSILSLGKFAENATTNRKLLAQVGSKIYSWNGTTWTDVRTLTSSVLKARYSQFLNLTYTVNGSAGDVIQTYNGTTYGSTNVASLPKGDFVQAGFEGRVWVANATLDRLYYSDIVSLGGTITGGTDYIEKLSPQDGESFTGLYRVPRALLVFKQNHIYRVYGATSVDPYPAYNVGTFSQESIVEAKNGLYFHHSSGFYWFRYDGQPQEISRRIKAFVNAIPRTYYENVTGAYDGKDNVTWSVGPVTVDGVAYSNCQLRYTISTQVWTAYDLVGINPTAMITYDSGNIIAQIVGDSTGLVMQQDSGTTDNGNDFYFEVITRWMSITEMWSMKKQLSGIMVNHQNGSGTKFQFQTDKDAPNEWGDIGTLDEKYSTIFPNFQSEDFNRIRLRLSGFTKGTQIVFDGIEIDTMIEQGAEYN
jgi:hypothetical protein